MIDFIVQYWLEVLFTAIISCVTFAFRSIIKQMKDEKKMREERIKIEEKEQELIKNGVLAILHDRLFQACKHYLEQEWCSVEDMNNLTCMYTGYHALGGNSIGTELYNRVCKLPLEPPKAKGSE